MIPREQRDVPSPNQWFTTTHWTVVMAAKEQASPQGAAAWEKLCLTYWPPLYSYIRREGYTATDAEDLTQEFFARLVAKDFLSHLHDKRGKFRSFLLTFLKHFLSDERVRAAAQKRGGGRRFVSLDDTGRAESDYINEPVNNESPDQLFDRRWAKEILNQALLRLREEYVSAGKAELFEHLKDLQPSERGSLSYAEVGRKLGMSEAAVKSAAHRMRRRHGELLRKGIAETVSRAEEIDGEIRYLLALLGG